MKRIISLFVFVVMAFTLSMVAFADNANSESTAVLSDGTIVKRASVELFCTTSPTRSSYGMHIGSGYVEGEDPWFEKPHAYALTGAFQGSYRVSAKCEVKNSDNSTYSTYWTHEYNAVSAKSDTIYAGTSHCTFTGYHEIELTQGGAFSSETSTLDF